MMYLVDATSDNAKETFHVHVHDSRVVGIDTKITFMYSKLHVELSENKHGKFWKDRHISFLW